MKINVANYQIKKKTKLDPKDDFYTYVNEKWLNEQDEELMKEKRRINLISFYQKNGGSYHYRSINC